MAHSPQRHKKQRCPVCGRRGFATHQAYAGHLSRHSTNAHVFTPDESRKGAQQLNSLPVPDCCPECGRGGFSSRGEYNSHRGFHGLANKLGVTLSEAGEALAAMGFFASDPYRYNGASARGAGYLRLLGKLPPPTKFKSWLVPEVTGE